MEDIFINRLPTIDLHGYDTASAKVATNDFISDNIILKKDKIIIIHGIGTGSNEIIEELQLENKYVSEYHTLNLNNGCTIAYLIIDNK